MANIFRTFPVAPESCFLEVSPIFCSRQTWHNSFLNRSQFTLSLPQISTVFSCYTSQHSIHLSPFLRYKADTTTSCKKHHFSCLWLSTNFATVSRTSLSIPTTYLHFPHRKIPTWQNNFMDRPPSTWSTVSVHKSSQTWLAYLGHILIPGTPVPKLPSPGLPKIHTWCNNFVYRPPFLLSVSTYLAIISRT